MLVALEPSAGPDLRLVPPSLPPAPSPSPARSTPRSETRPDHRAAPFVETLRAYVAAGTAAFSTPGHKGGAGAGDEVRALLGDSVFAADVWLNTGRHDAALRAAEALAADAWGADRSFFLVNGSSAGNLAYLLAALRPGDEVVVARDLHRSLLAALIVTGAVPVYVTPRLHPDLNVGLGIAPADVAAALDAHPAAKLVALVSPSYAGVASDLAAIAAVAHARGVPLYVDEAWGPHLGFHPALPPSAMASGADGAVTSTHKLLASLSQGAILNVRDGHVAAGRVAAAVQMAQTTTPCLPILASIDAARRQMALGGADLLDLTLELAWNARHRLATLPGLAVLDPADLLTHGAAAVDPTKLLIDVHGLGMTGYQVERALRERFAIAVEASDLVGIVCLISIGDTPESIDRLVAACAALAAARRPLTGAAADATLRSFGAILAPGRQALSPRDAFFAATRAVPLAETVGQVAAELVVPYPPGIPVLTPGDVVTADKVAYLRHGAALGMHVCGPEDPGLRTLRVVTATA